MVAFSHRRDIVTYTSRRAYGRGIWIWFFDVRVLKSMNEDGDALAIVYASMDSGSCVSEISKIEYLTTADVINIHSTLFSEIDYFRIWTEGNSSSKSSARSCFVSDNWVRPGFIMKKKNRLILVLFELNDGLDSLSIMSFWYTIFQYTGKLESLSLRFLSSISSIRTMARSEFYVNYLIITYYIHARYFHADELHTGGTIHFIIFIISTYLQIRILICCKWLYN